MSVKRTVVLAIGAAQLLTLAASAAAPNTKSQPPRKG
jgi:hypothetical protein